MKINTFDKSIKDILNSNYYKIPRFQRPYSWLTENVSDFWEDTVVSKEKDYFIGSIVLFNGGDSASSIVDGQQRMTTIIMLLCTIRNMLNSLGYDALALAIHKLVEREDINTNLKYVLSTETSFPYFQEHIMKFGQSAVDVVDVTP